MGATLFGSQKRGGNNILSQQKNSKEDRGVDLSRFFIESEEGGSCVGAFCFRKKRGRPATGGKGCTTAKTPRGKRPSTNGEKRESGNLGGGKKTIPILTGGKESHPKPIPCSQEFLMVTILAINCQGGTNGRGFKFLGRGGGRQRGEEGPTLLERVTKIPHLSLSSKRESPICFFGQRFRGRKNP